MGWKNGNLWYARHQAGINDEGFWAPNPPPWPNYHLHPPAGDKAAWWKIVLINCLNTNVLGILQAWFARLVLYNWLSATWFIWFLIGMVIIFFHPVCSLTFRNCLNRIYFILFSDWLDFLANFLSELWFIDRHGFLFRFHPFYPLFI